MPELPEVETIKSAICQSIGNCNIKDIIVNNNRLREKIPDDIGSKICGAAILGYRRIAKYIVIDLDNGISLIWHTGMSGKVKITDEVPQHAEKHDHVLIITDNGCLAYNDARRFGLLTYCETEKLKQHRLFARLGPEPLDSEFSAEYLYQKLKNKKVPIKVAILDQEVVVGIGNIYASETLYKAGISPLRRADKVTKKECRRIVESSHEVLKQAIAAGGSTIHDYKKPDGSLGYFQNMHCVYGKTGQKCPNCICDINKTGGIQKIVQAGRSSFYCPTKQK